MVLTRHRRRVAAVVPIEDLEVIEALEDAQDLDELDRGRPVGCPGRQGPALTPRLSRLGVPPGVAGHVMAPMATERLTR